MSNSEINLIQKDIRSFRSLSFLESRLRLATWWLLGALFVAGVSIGIGYFFINSRIQSLENTKIDLTRQINAQSPKEGILLSLKERIGIAAKALDAAKPWGELFTTLTEIASEDEFSSLSIDDTGRVVTSLTMQSIDESVTVITNVMRLFEERKLKSPQLISFAFREDGTIQISVSFYPIF